MNLLAEIFGWYGAAAVLSAYGLASFAILSPTSLWYRLLNLTGAMCLVFVSLVKRNYQPVVVNAVWSVVALLAVLGIIG